MMVMSMSVSVMTVRVVMMFMVRVVFGCRRTILALVFEMVSAVIMIVFVAYFMSTDTFFVTALALLTVVMSMFIARFGRAVYIFQNFFIHKTPIDIRSS